MYWKVRTRLYVMKYAYKQTWIGTSHAHNGLTYYFLNGEDMRTLIFKFLSFYIQGKKKSAWEVIAPYSLQENEKYIL